MADRTIAYTSLLNPGVIPPKVGQFAFNTRNIQTFDVSNMVPTTAKEIDVFVYMRHGHEASDADFNVWLWTELGNDKKDVKFKRSHRYPQNAYSTDSETFTFSYSSSHSKLYLMSDLDAGQNILLELFLLGYTQ